MTLGEHVDLEMMSPETLESHCEQNALVHPFVLAAWAARQGYYIAAWALWEYYSRCLCERLPNKEKRSAKESGVDWVGRSLAANLVGFPAENWFAGANSLRNLIAHYGARAVDEKANKLLERSRVAFPGLVTWKDGYVVIEHAHLVELQTKIDEFIRNTAGS